MFHLKKKFQAAIVSVLLCGCSTWTLTKCMEKNLDENCTRMLRAILNKSRKQHPTKQQVDGHRAPISKTIQIRQTRHAGHGRRSKDQLISDVQVMDDQLELIYNISLQTQDVVAPEAMDDRYE